MKLPPFPDDDPQFAAALEEIEFIFSPNKPAGYQSKLEAAKTRLQLPVKEPLGEFCAYWTTSPEHVIYFGGTTSEPQLEYIRRCKYKHAANHPYCTRHKHEFEKLWRIAPDDWHWWGPAVLPPAIRAKRRRLVEDGKIIEEQPEE